MRDLTQGPIPGHLIAMALPIGAGMLAQTLYFLIDLYFVAQLGDAALTGVVQPTMIVQGVVGAGLASTIAVAVGALLLGMYFQRLEKYIHFRPELWRPRLACPDIRHTGRLALRSQAYGCKRPSVSIYSRGR